MDRYQVIIIGGGPAGLSCAIWLTKLGASSLLLEASGGLGGLQTRSPYENLWIPGVQGKTGQQVAASIAAHALDVGAELRVGQRVAAVARDGDGFRVATPEAEVHGRFVVIATGSTPRTGGFTSSATVAIGPGEPMEALDVAGRAVAILGGGDNAFDQARFVRDRGGHVTVFSRGVPRAQTLLQALVPDVPVIVGAYEARQSDMTVNGQHFDCFGIQYGFEAVVPAGLDIKRQGGYVEVDRFGETSVADVFACGEVTDFWHPCVTTSAAHGVQVAKQISKRL
ncbi:NAD(P)/FAD-dependent oxidoreductase [Asticcacaulis solisilvae]|uniref:NAD(P)/FAD-dependent oxidoreductase n=1 Tax=Asticcacaulis solisilvae TaxID=1217274 RepID=UPI003FD8A8E6